MRPGGLDPHRQYELGALVVVNTGGSPEHFTVQPQGDVTLLGGRDDLPLTVEKVTGVRIFSGMLTWRELQDRNFRLVITDEGLEGK